MNKWVLLQCANILLPSGEGHHTGSGLPLLIVSLLFGGYITLVVVLKQKAGWSGWRTASFVAGCLVLAVAVSPGMFHFAFHDFRGHMLQHLLLGMFAPLGLVLGAPVTLCLRTLPRKVTRLVSNLLRSTFFHLLSHPATALVLNIGGMYLLYLTPLFNRMHTNHALHAMVHFHFLAAGYLFTWSIAGPDPAPRRPPLFTRVAVLFFSIAAHSYLSKAMYAYEYPRNTQFNKTEIQVGAQWMYYGGDIAELLLVIALFGMWYHKKGKPHYRLALPSL